MFHTHPSTCISRGNCRFSIPSIQDLLSIYSESSNKYSLGHIIFTHAGIYLIKAPRYYSKERSSRLTKRMTMQFAKLQKLYILLSYNIQLFEKKWINYIQRYCKFQIVNISTSKFTESTLQYFVPKRY